MFSHYYAKLEGRCRDYCTRVYNITVNGPECLPLGCQAADLSVCQLFVVLWDIGIQVATRLGIQLCMQRPFCAGT